MDSESISDRSYTTRFFQVAMASFAAGSVLRRCGRLSSSAARLSTTPRALGGDGMPAIIERHGKREVIGYGYNGQPNYVDRVDYPIPAVRFKEETPQIKVGVWRPGGLRYWVAAAGDV